MTPLLIRLLLTLDVDVCLEIASTPLLTQTPPPRMMFGDSTHRPGGYAKDPHVILTW